MTIHRCMTCRQVFPAVQLLHKQPDGRWLTWCYYCGTRTEIILGPNSERSEEAGGG